MELYPWEFTEHEYGDFKLWIAGPVTVELLAKAKEHTFIGCGGRRHIVNINGIWLHSLIFESAAAGNNNYARWDCVNGWTTTIEQAKEKFPCGLHGLESYYHKQNYKKRS